MNFSTTSGVPAIKVVALIEAATVTGPTKSLIEFARLANASAASRPDLPAARVSIVAFQRGGNVPEAFLAAAREARIEVDLLHERHLGDRAVIGQLRPILRERAPDILRTNNLKSHFLVRFAGLHRRYRWIAFHHGYTTTDLKMLLYNQVNRWSLPSAERVITVCQPFARMLARRGVSPDRIAVLHNLTSFMSAPPEDAVAALRARLGIPAGARVVLSVGRFSREKAQADLLRAFEILRRRQRRLRRRFRFDRLSKLVRIPPFGRGFSRHEGQSIRWGFGKSAEGGLRVLLHRLHDPTKLSLGTVAPRGARLRFTWQSHCTPNPMRRFATGIGLTGECEDYGESRAARLHFYVSHPQFSSMAEESSSHSRISRSSDSRL